MSESLGLNRDAGSEWSDNAPRHKPEPHENEYVPAPQLVPCPDCRKDISPKAESCPHCGRFIQDFHRKAITVLPGKGWSLAVTGGIILSYLVAVLAGAFLMFILAGALSDLGRSRP